MNEPTQEQVKVFWEHFGFRQLLVGRSGFHYERGIRIGNWMPPDAPTESTFYSKYYLPAINLNNLFQWVVPIVETNYELEVRDDSEMLGKSVCLVSKKNRECSVASPMQCFDNWGEFALALFWVIWQVIPK